MIRPIFPLLVLFRHGQTDDNAARRFQGHSNTPLNALGRDQARRAGEIVSNVLSGLMRSGSVFGTCLSSDLARAFETASVVREIAKERLGVEIPFVAEPALREFSVGDLQDHTVDEFEKKHPGVLQSFYRRYEEDPYTAAYPGPTGESRGMLAARLAPLVKMVNAHLREAGNASQNPFVRDLVEMQKMAAEVCVWSAHGGTIDAILELMNIDPFGNKRIIGNGDVLLLAPVEECVQKSGGASARERFAASLGCDVRWRLLRHYQVGDNIAAKLYSNSKE